MNLGSVREVTTKNDFRVENNVLIGEEVPITKECVNIGQMVLEAMEKAPDTVGLIEPVFGKEVTYAEMRERSIKCALWLKSQGIKAGDIIGVCVRNYIDDYVPLLASLYIGAVINPWDHQLTVNTAKHFLSLTSPKIVFVNQDSCNALIQAVKDTNVDVKIVGFGKEPGLLSLDDIVRTQNSSDVDGFRCAKLKSPDDVATIMYSSGTTGMPKGSEISHFSFACYFSLVDIKDLTGHVCTWSPSIRWHYGLSLTLRAILTHAKRVIISDLSDLENICRFIEKYQVSWLGTDPCLLLRLLKFGLLEKYKLSSLRICFLGGLHFKKELQEYVSKLLPHAKFIHSYGMTDLGGICTYQRNTSKPSSSGFVCKMVQLKIVDPDTGRALGPNEIGEIFIKTPYVMNGYYKNPEATKKAIDSEGWLHSGDVGYYDEDGEVFVVDRIAEFINYKAITVSPAMIEAVLQTHPSVLETAVVAAPDELDGEHPMAFVVKMPGKEVSEEELVKLVDTQLSNYYKLRGGVKFVDSFPRTATGKIARRQLKEITKSGVKECR